MQKIPQSFENFGISLEDQVPRLEQCEGNFDMLDDMTKGRYHLVHLKCPSLLK